MKFTDHSMLSFSVKKGDSNSLSQVTANNENLRPRYRAMKQNYLCVVSPGNSVRALQLGGLDAAM